MAIKDYSTSPGSNTALFPEGMNPSAVNDGMRQVQADIRSFFETIEWRDLGFAPTYLSATSFNVAGDKTAFYTVGRRLKITFSILSAIYGTIATSVFSAGNTTVTVTLDSGTIDNTISAALVGIDPTHSPIASGAINAPTGVLKGASGSIAAATEGTDYYKPSGTDVAIADGGTGASTAVAAFTALKQAASTSASGVVTKATTAQVTSETADLYSDALSMKYHKGIAKAWVTFNGTTGAVLDSYNVTSVTRSSTGTYTVNMSITMANTNFSVSTTSDNSVSSTNPAVVAVTGRTTTTAALSSRGSTNGAVLDPAYISVLIMGQI